MYVCIIIHSNRHHYCRHPCLFSVRFKCPLRARHHAREGTCVRSLSRTSHSALCCTCRRCWLASPAFRQPGAKPLLGSFAFVSPVFSRVALCSCERFASCHAPPNMHRMSDRRAAHPVVACIAQSTVSVATWRNMRVSTSLALYERRSCTCVGMRYVCAKQPR